MISGSFHLISYHNTVLYVDAASQRLRHASSSDAPLNLVLELEGTQGRLLMAGSFPAEEVHQVSFAQPNGKIHTQRGRGALDCHIDTFPDNSVAIRIDEKYVSADPDGLIRKDRTWCQAWEHYRLVSADDADLAVRSLAVRPLESAPIEQVSKRQEIIKATNLDVLSTFPLYVPNSAGNYKDLSALTIQAINQVFPFLSSLLLSIDKSKIKLSDIDEFPKSTDDIRALNDLKLLLDKHGSDKSMFHDYHNLYGPILRNRNDIKALLEIGLGTNNTDVVSNMGFKGKPGASLRAFRDFLPNAKIFGADIDKRVLFCEERIETFYVDQTDQNSLIELQKSIPNDFDLVIDDGLHSPNANIQTLNFGLGKIKVGGWVVIEDISSAAIPFWEVVSGMLPNQYESHIFQAKLGNLFAVKKLN